MALSKIARFHESARSVNGRISGALAELDFNLEQQKEWTVRSTPFAANGAATLPVWY